MGAMWVRVAIPTQVLQNCFHDMPFKFCRDVLIIFLVFIIPSEARFYFSF